MIHWKFSSKCKKKTKKIFFFWIDMLSINNTRQGFGASPPSGRSAVSAPHGGDSPCDGARCQCTQNLGGRACLVNSC